MSGKDEPASTSTVSSLISVSADSSRVSSNKVSELYHSEPYLEAQTMTANGAV